MRKPITEYTSIQNMKVLGKDWYNEWKDKFINRVNQVRPGYEAVLKFIEKNRSSAIVESELKDELDLIPHDIGITTLREELWSVLLDNTKGEARGKVKSIGNQGDGVEAYRALHVWFTSCRNAGPEL